jgi:sugar fermentation stimulation protein A
MRGFAEHGKSLCPVTLHNRSAITRRKRQPMDLPGPLIPATLIKRYKRFLADCTLDDGTEITAHCANPGSMMGLNMPGLRVHLSHSDDPKRKLKYSLQLDRASRQKRPGACGDQHVKPEQDCGRSDCRWPDRGTDRLWDHAPRGEIWQEQPHRSAPQRGWPGDCYVEIKNVHLLRQPGLAEFPDSVTTRGAKHLGELADMVAAGHRAVMLYVIQRPDCDRLALAADLDPGYAAAFSEATARGVEAVAYRCAVGPDAVTIDCPVPIEAPA